MSLESCIRKAGKALTKEDAEAIRAIRDDILKGKIEPRILVEDEHTRENINEQAIDEYLEILQGEKDFIMQQVEGLGGTLADKSLSPSEFSKQVTENLDEAARRFPQKGIYRPETETTPVDYKTGDRLSEEFYEVGRHMDPNITREVLTDRTYKTVETLYPDFYTLPPDKVLAIVNTFDEVAALGLAKHFDILPRTARKLIPANYDKAAMQRITDAITSKAEVSSEGEILKPRDDTNDWFYGWAGEVVVDWITKNETLPLYYKVDDLFGRDLVNAHPDNPIAQTVKYGAVIAEAEAAKPVGVRKMMNWFVDKGSKSIEATLGAVPQSKLPDFVRYGMESVVEYTKTVKRMDAWMNIVIERHNDLAQRWLKFNKGDTKTAKMLGEFMHASTLAGVDVPTFRMPPPEVMKKMSQKKRDMWNKRASDYKVLAPFWEKLGKAGEKSQYQRFQYDYGKKAPVPLGNPAEVSEGQRLYMEVRDTYAIQRDMLIDGLEERINQTEADEAAKATLIAKLRQQFEAGSINPYFPLSRFGKHQAVAKDPETGEVVAFIKRENRRERNQWVETMREKGFVVVPLEEQASDLETMNKIDPGFVASVTSMFEGTKIIIDPESGKTVPGSQAQDAIWQMYLRTLPELSARKAYIHRLGRLGFTGDALRSFSDHSFHSTHQMAKLRYGYELSEHLKDAGDDAVILMQRADNIKNMMNGWRPETFEDATEHEVMMNTTVGGPAYRALYAKFKRAAGVGSEYHEPSHVKARDQILKEAEHDGPWAVPLANELKRRHEFNMNPNSAAWSTKLTALGFLWFLSTSPAAGVLNLTQTPISAYPILRARFAGSGAGMELLKAAKDYASAPWLGVTPSAVPRMTAKLRNDTVNGKESITIGEKAAMTEFDAIGIFSKTRTRELMGLSEAGSDYSKRQEQYLEYAGYIFHKTEEMNRAVTALAAYRLARKRNAGSKGMSLQDQHNAAVLEAEELVEMSHFDYTNTNRPRFMQGDMGRVVFLFRNYSLNMQYRLIRDFRDGIWRNNNIPKEARREARSRFLGIIGMTTVFAGVTGYPLFWAAEAIANNLLGDDDDPFDSKTQARKLLYDATEEYIAEGWGESVSTAIMKGPWSALTGADLSQRASLNNLWIREIPENLKEDPRGLMTHLSGELLGPIWGMGMNIATGIGDIQQDQTQRGLEKMVPKFLGDIGKTIRYATQGAQTYQRDVIVGPEEFTSRDLFLQAAGFTPTTLSNRYEQNRAIKDMEAKLKGRRQDLMNQLFTAWRVSDRKTASEVMKKILEWNKAQPRYAIVPDNIIQSARSRAQYDMRTVGGVAVDKRLQYLHNELQFTDRPKQ